MAKKDKLIADQKREIDLLNTYITQLTALLKSHGIEIPSSSSPEGQRGSVPPLKVEGTNAGEKGGDEKSEKTSDERKEKKKDKPEKEKQKASSLQSNGNSEEGTNLSSPRKKTKTREREGKKKEKEKEEKEGKKEEKKEKKRKKTFGWRSASRKKGSLIKEALSSGDMSEVSEDSQTESDESAAVSEALGPSSPLSCSSPSSKRILKNRSDSLPQLVKSSPTVSSDEGMSPSSQKRNGISNIWRKSQKKEKEKEKEISRQSQTASAAAGGDGGEGGYDSPFPGVRFHQANQPPGVAAAGATAAGGGDGGVEGMATSPQAERPSSGMFGKGKKKKNKEKGKEGEDGEQTSGPQGKSASNSSQEDSERKSISSCSEAEMTPKGTVEEDEEGGPEKKAEDTHAGKNGEAGALSGASGEGAAAEAVLKKAAERQLTSEEHARMTRDEFIKTEESYIQNLDILLNVSIHTISLLFLSFSSSKKAMHSSLLLKRYVAPLRQAATSDDEGFIISTKEAILPPSLLLLPSSFGFRSSLLLQVDKIFSRELSMLYTMHSQLLKEIREANNTTSFVDAFVSFVPYLKVSGRPLLSLCSPSAWKLGNGAEKQV